MIGALRAALRSLALLNNVGGALDVSLRDTIGRAVSNLRLDVGVDDRGRFVPAPGGSGANRALASIVAIVIEAQASGDGRG